MMKQLAEVLRSKIWPLFQQIVGETANFRRSNPSVAKVAKDKEFFEEPEAQPDKHPEEPTRNKGIFEKIAQFLPLKYRQRAKTRPVYKASLFPDGKTNLAALSLVLRGAAEVLSQKMDLPW